ncbi:MAG: TonB-dependent receptor plug domain-containing protein [Phycisphaeraceae bacterium]
MFKTSRLAALLAPALLCPAAPTLAQEADTDSEAGTADTDVNLDTLEGYFGNPLIVTPSGFQQQAFDAPYVTDVIGQDEMREYGIRSVPEALKYTPGVLVQRTGHGQGSPFIRGFTGYRNVFLIDGVRLNNSIFRSGPNQYWNTIDPFSIERLEVIKGPTSVLYGSDAVGGTVNAITTSPYGYSDTNNLAGGATVRYASNERSIGGRGELSPTFNLDGQPFGVLIGGSASDFGDLQGGRDIGRQNGTGYGQYAADVKTEYFLGDNGRLVFAHQRFRQNNAPRTHSTVQGISFEGTTVGTDLQRDLDQERELTYLQLHSEDIEAGPIDAFKIGISWQNTHQAQDRIRGNGDVEFDTVRVQTFGIFAQAQSEVSDRLTLTYGLDYYHDQVDTFGNDTGSTPTTLVQGQFGDDSTYDLLGVYVQGDLELTDRLNLVLGGRWNYAAVDSDRVNNPAIPGSDPTNPADIISVSDSWNAFVGSARLNYAIEPEQLVVFGGVSQGFRAPNLTDLTGNIASNATDIEVASPGLEPEYYTAFEVGFKGQGETYAWQASYYYTFIEDQIVRFGTGNPNEFTRGNVGDGYVNGIELDGTYKPTRETTLFANAFWQLGEVDTIPVAGGPVVAQYIERNPPITVNVGAKYDVPDSPLWLYGIVTAASDADFVTTRDAGDTQRVPPGGTPGYVTLNLGGGWKFSENLELTVTLENITNEDYRVHGSGVNGAGFGAVVSLDWRF